MRATLTKPSLVHYSCFICLFARGQITDRRSAKNLVYPCDTTRLTIFWSAKIFMTDRNPSNPLWEPAAHHFLSALNSGANLFYVSTEVAEILLVKILSFYVPSAWVEFLIFVKSFALLLWMISSQHSPGFPDFYLLFCVCVRARALTD
jgi:hypothetical protein